MPATTDAYILESPWKTELETLRATILSCGLNECMKWGAPHYTVSGKNVIGLMGFSQHYAMWFHQGVFLSDPLGVLTNAGEGKTRGLRQWRFKAGEPLDLESIRAYVFEAAHNQSKGLEITPQAKKVAMPLELETALEDPLLHAAFKALSPGKRKEYAEHIGGAKQASTRAQRLEKCKVMILQGQGLHHKYRNC
ncbi:MAG: YdeI/OmpD-associated family protein [Bacteroidetes bacterium]|jgi:uncharacterized protein YdeI (YjbR/CyaY-like superfamily)|nr:YdeI/OmpD-associated family protein [Bacteroidota bacterium]